MDYARAESDGDKVRQRANQPAEPFLTLDPELLEQTVQALQRSQSTTQERKKQ